MQNIKIGFEGVRGRRGIQLSRALRFLAKRARAGNLLGLPRWRAFGGLLTFIPVLFACLAPAPIAPSRHTQIIANIPFYPQEKDQCGPAALAGVLNYWGVKVSADEIASEIFSRGAAGTLNLDLVLYAKRKGLRADQYEGDFEDLKKNVRDGLPLIVLVDEGFWIYQKNHFMVVVGYGPEGVIVNSGTEAHKGIPWKRFLKTWEKTRFWTLRISTI